jgi:hypothetical protein
LRQAIGLQKKAMENGIRAQLVFFPDSCTPSALQDTAAQHLSVQEFSLPFISTASKIFTSK